MGIWLISARMAASSHVSAICKKISRALSDLGGFRPAETFIRVLAIFAWRRHDTLPQMAYYGHLMMAHTTRDADFSVRNRTKSLAR